MIRKPVRRPLGSCPVGLPRQIGYDAEMAKKTKSPTSNTAQMDSPSYILPALDADFLLSDPMRGVRFQLEYEKAEQLQRAWEVRSTIVVFGSARASADKAHDTNRWYAEARRFGALAAREGGSLLSTSHPRDNVIATGGGPGVMEAANRGASDAGAPSIGYNIILEHEQEPNSYSTPDLTFLFHYFGMRKMHFAMRANALVVFPGGFGTLDELFEFLTLRQTGKSPPIPIILFDKTFWTSIVNFDALVEYGTISPQDLDLFQYADSAEEAWDLLVAGGVLELRHEGDASAEQKDPDAEPSSLPESD